MNVYAFVRSNRQMNTETVSKTDYSGRASRVVNSIQARAWKLAASVEIPRDMCCLHNASIDDEMKGWCADSPGRLKVAKRAVLMMDGAWAISDLARRIEARAFNRAEGRERLMIHGVRESINVKLLFVRV